MGEESYDELRDFVSTRPGEIASIPKYRAVEKLDLDELGVYSPGLSGIACRSEELDTETTGVPMHG